MKKFLLTFVKYGILALIFFNLLSLLSLRGLKNSSFYKPSFLSHEVKETKFDYIVIGSSIGLTGLNTILIDSITQKKGLNLCIDDTSLSSNFLMLAHFFNLDKKADYCVLSASSWDLALKNPEINDNDYRFLPFVNEDFVYEYYKDLEKGFFKPLTISHYFPFIGVSYYNTEVFYPSIVAFIQPGKRNRFDEKGNYFYPENAKPQEQDVNNVVLEWNNPFIKKIDSLCKINSSKLIVYQAPTFRTIVKNESIKFNFINNSNLLQDSKYFYDAIHLNEYGRKAASLSFANEYIKITNSK